MKKPVLQFSIPCLEIETEDKPPVFSYVFYELPFPNAPVSFYIANGWSNGEGIFTQEIKLIKPSGNLLVSTGKQDFKLISFNIPQLMVNLFRDMMFDEFGDYRVEVYLDDEKVIEYPLTIRQLTPEEIRRVQEIQNRLENQGGAKETHVQQEATESKKETKRISSDDEFLISG
jgi:hypothetical protein